MVQGEVQALKATPWAWQCPERAAAGAAEAIPHAPAAGVIPAGPPQKSPAAPVRVKIAAAMLEQHWYTVGCRRCTLLRTGRTAMGVKHSEACRGRIEGHLRAAGYQIMVRADARVNEHLASRVEEAELSPSSGPPGAGEIPAAGGSAAVVGPGAAPSTPADEDAEGVGADELGR